jgi:hypothetical protein
LEKSKYKRAGAIAEEVEHLLSMCKALGSIPNINTNK